MKIRKCVYLAAMILAGAGVSGVAVEPKATLESNNPATSARSMAEKSDDKAISHIPSGVPTYKPQGVVSPNDDKLESFMAKIDATFTADEKKQLAAKIFSANKASGALQEQEYSDDHKYYTDDDGEWMLGGRDELKKCKDEIEAKAVKDCKSKCAADHVLYYDYCMDACEE